MCGITQVIGPLASAVVAAIAVYVSSRQAKRSLELTARQIAIEETKLRSELYERRYDAWLNMRKYATNRYMAIRRAPNFLHVSVEDYAANL